MRDFYRLCLDLYRNIRYKFESFSVKTDSKIVVFASFGGDSYSDNPKAIFEYMIETGKFTDYTFVWGFKKRKLKNKANIFAKYAVSDCESRHEGSNSTVIKSDSFNHDLHTSETIWSPNIVVVRIGSKEWRKYLAKAKFWVLNYKIEDYLKPRRDQVFLQTWHGTPLKRLGYDLEHFDNARNTMQGIKKRYAKEVLKFDYFISPSSYSSEKFASAWNMDDSVKNKIMLEVGYPRNDILFTYNEDIVNKLKTKIFGHYYIEYEQLLREKGRRKTIVLYAPTYRGNQHTIGVGYTYHAEIDFDKMYRELGEDYIILFRAHYFVAKIFDFKKYEGFVYDVSNIDDINDLYLISDILVTDYSSSMFDFSNLKRPMIFYMYDLEYYRDESNGFYFDPEELLPGPIVRTEDELVDALKKCDKKFEYTDKYREFNKIFDPIDDGHSCERVVNKIFEGGRVN